MSEFALGLNKAVLLERADLFAAADLQGSTFTRAYSARLDAWIAAIAEECGIPHGVAVVAVGGYGRRDVSPQSDLDIVLVHRPNADYSAFAEQIWYPIWDAGLKLGHRVDTVDGLLKISTLR